jgi:hypothetical protein
LNNFVKEISTIFFKKTIYLGKLGWALLGTTIGKPLMCGFFGGDFIIFRPKKLWRYRILINFLSLEINKIWTQGEGDIEF